MRESPATQPDRRQAPRTKLVEIAYIGMGPENGGLVLDVSEGGLSFHSVAPVEPAERISFLLSLRGHSRIEGAGEVVWTNPMRTVCGMRFTSLSSGAREHLANWTNQSKMFRTSDPQTNLPSPDESAAPVVGEAPAEKPAESDPAPYFIAPLSVPEDTPVWRKPVFLWLLFAFLAAAGAGGAFYVGIQVGRSQIAAAAPTAASPAAQAANPATSGASSPSDGALSAPGDLAPTPNAGAPAQSGALVSASKTDDGSAANSQSTDDPDSALTREQRSEQIQETGQTQLAGAQALLRGDDGPRDSAKAAKLLWSAVGNGNSTAEVLLADLYLLGDGVPKSCEQGRVLLTAAARNGDTGAQEKLDELNTNGCQ